MINPCQELIDAIPRGSIVTDVGSIKEPIIKKWEQIHPLFVGSHPMAGTENKGVESGFENLFKNTKWIITPTQKSNREAVITLGKLFTSMDCEICKASPKEHDSAVSLISHLPIFLASALIETAGDNKNNSLLDLTHKLAASGFADTSRVGGGNSELGLNIAIYNKNNILNALNEFKNKISDLESLIENKNWELLSKKLTEASEQRGKFIN